MNVSTCGNKLTINGATIILNGSVEKTIQVDCRLLVLINAVNLTSISHPPHNNNILCFDNTGQELWVVDNPMPNVSLTIQHVGLLDQWLYLGFGSEWGRDKNAVTAQSGNWICNIKVEDGSLYECEPFK